MMIENIQKKFDKIIPRNYTFNKKMMTNKNKLLYLYTIFNYSVANKDIETFLLFLYMHDNINIDFNSIEYKNWKLITTSNLAYEVDKITNLDLQHYEDNILTLQDRKIFNYLYKNISLNKNYFLIPKSWVRLNTKSLFRTYCRIIGKFMCLYNKVLDEKWFKIN